MERIFPKNRADRWESLAPANYINDSRKKPLPCATLPYAVRSLWPLWSSFFFFWLWRLITATALINSIGAAYPALITAQFSATSPSSLYLKNKNQRKKTTKKMEIKNMARNRRRNQKKKMKSKRKRAPSWLLLVHLPVKQKRLEFN